MSNNRLVLTARIAQTKALRFTPAGIPALDLQLEHESQVEQAGTHRQVKAVVQAVALGAVAERLVRQALGSSWHFGGFVATAVRGKQLVFHIQEFEQDIANPFVPDEKNSTSTTS